MILRALRALWAANRRLEDWFDDLSLGTRRIIAVAVTLAFLVGAMLVGAVGQAEFERSGQLAQTQERHRAVIVAHRREGRHNTIPIVWTGSQERELDYGWFLDGVDEGTSIQYVIDPDDPSHLIAVGEPSDWERTPLEDNLVTVGFVLVSLVAGAMVAMRIVPDDLQTALMRFHGRRKPPRRRADGRP